MNRTEASIFRVVIAVLTAIAGFPRIAAAQSPVTTGSLRHEIFVSSLADSYLRYLQTTGKVPEHPWSIRGFSEREIDDLIPADTAHPWHDRFVDEAREYRGVWIGTIKPQASIRINSGFAYGSNDGPIWAGRGLTSAVQAGFFANWKWVSLTVAPIAFRAENNDFDIVNTTPRGAGAFANPDFLGVDAPQRFGNSAYSQIDPGESTLRVDLPYVTAGISTANQQWGPGQQFPIILGNNAAGFPHIFLGSSEPIDLWIMRVHGRVFWGELFQSDYSNVTGPSAFTSPAEPGTKRFATGIIFLISPRGLTGLEIGGSRFFHSVWPPSGIPRSYFTKVFQGLLKKNLKPDVLDIPGYADNQGVADNQLVSVFVRWVLPHSGFEIHSEYGRDDHSYDFRDLQQEIDHSRSYSIGARKVFGSSANRLTAGRVEILNFQLPQSARYRGEGEMYVHGLIRQGHTYKGQLLGADAGVGVGAGSVVAVDRFTPGGRWTASWTRIVRRENGNYTLVGIRSPRSIDVSHAVGFESSRVISDFEITTGLTFVYELNRDFKSDARNVNAIVSARYLIH